VGFLRSQFVFSGAALAASFGIDDLAKLAPA
jgi:hypothetical protein